MKMSIARTVLAIVSSLFAMLLAAPIVILGLPFWLIAYLTRVIGTLLQPKCVTSDQIFEFEPIIGWKPKANLDVYYLARGNDVCHIRTDSQGWPNTTSLSESAIVVFGDSFAFGYGVNIDSSYAALNSHVSIKAIGAPGYNMVQELLLMRRLSLQLRDKLVVWFICLENDLYDNLRPDKPGFYRTPFVRNLNGGDEWEIVTSHVCPARWSFTSTSSTQRPYYAMLARLCTPSTMAQRAYSACNFLIREAAALCKEAGAQLVVMTIPNKNQLSQHGHEFLVSHLGEVDGFDPNIPDQKIGAICVQWNVPFLAAKTFLGADDYKELDTHWKEGGNQKVAKMLDHLYQFYISGGLQAVEGFKLDYMKLAK
jgi:hypothetical protein